MKIKTFVKIRYFIILMFLTLIGFLSAFIIRELLQDRQRLIAIQERHYTKLHQHLIDRFGEGHDLYIYATGFRERYLFWGEEGDIPVTGFSLRSASRENVYFNVSVTDRQVSDGFFLVLWRELNSYLQILFEENNAENTWRIGGSASDLHEFNRFHESGVWAGLDTTVTAGIFSNVRISIESILYWKKDTELLVQQIKEWEKIGRSSGLDIVYYSIRAVTVCPEPVPCTSPSWRCFHDLTDIGPLYLTPYQIQNYDLLEIVEAHIEAHIVDAAS